MIKYSIKLQENQLNTLSKLMDNWEYGVELRSTDHIRRLYGIIGFRKFGFWGMPHPYYNFFIPRKNEEAVKKNTGKWRDILKGN